MSFSQPALLKELKIHQDTRRYWVAYSGGLDSHCLLHALAGLRAELHEALVEAVHVHHGLSPHADAWVEHCERVCKGLRIALHVFYVDARPTPGESPEAIARTARYQVLSTLVGEGERLLVAHHQDDQAETLLIQLLRGSGVAGMSAMPSIASFYKGTLQRPLLGFSRADLLGYAQQHKLHWIDDESNASTAYDRNYLRHQIMPLIKQRWPAANATLSRSAAHCAEAADLLNEQAEQDMASVVDMESGAVQISSLLKLSASRQSNLIRAWIKHQGLPAPSHRHLARIHNELIPAAIDATPLVTWKGAELRRYRDQLFAMTPLPAHDTQLATPWYPLFSLELPSIQKKIVATLATGQGVLASLLNEKLTIRFRRGGEHIRPAGRNSHHELKKLLQEAGVPPWQRDRIPLLYRGEDLVAVIGFWVSEGYQVRAGEHGLDIKVQKIDA